MTNRARWMRASRQTPCPVCEKPDFCTFSADGKVAKCMRVESSKPVASGGWVHRLDGTNFAPPPAPLARAERTDEQLDALWKPRVERWRRGAEVTRLADTLGVSAASLVAIHCGWDGAAWTVPERNGAGLIVGVSRRFNDGSKKCIRGSRRGLTYSPQWSDVPGPVLLVEGASDVAAGITMGLATIGRPSNVGGVPMLVQLLGGHAQRVVIVVAERDKKPDGRYPGLEGARTVCKELSRRLANRVSCRLLPGSSKDLRAFWRVSEMDGQGLLKEWGIR